MFALELSNVVVFAVPSLLYSKFAMFLCPQIYGKPRTTAAPETASLVSLFGMFLSHVSPTACK